MNKDDLINNLKEIAVGAGKIILEVYENKIEVEYKDDNSPLTLADKKSHNHIVSALTNLYPEIPICSEESDIEQFEERRNWSTYFLIDPLDGTKEFINKNGEFTVNIALIEEKSPTVGVVYAPVIEKLFYGTSEYAFLFENGVEKKLPYINFEAEKIKVVASKSHLSEETKEFVEKIKQTSGEVEFKAKGSSLKLCMIAEGSADVYPRLGPTSEWDTAAAHAVVLGSGGVVNQMHSSHPLEYNKQNILNPHFIVMRKEVISMMQNIK